MILSWLLYTVWVATLLGLAAWAAERALRLTGRSARLIWLAALGLGVLIPATTYSIRTWLPESTLGLPSVGFSDLLLPALLMGDATGSAWTTLRVTETVVWIAWAVASMGLLGLLAHTQWRLRRERAGWLSTRVDGVSVLVSRGTGPATVGSLRPRVVLPEWTLSLPASRREMILRHELEHVRARDGLVALIGFSLAALAPWNPAMWWMLARLRLAQEMDCDRRLLAGGIALRGYVDLLMTTGRSALHLRLAAPGLSFPPSTLRKRIVQMTYTPSRNSFVRATVIGGVAIGLGLLACDAPAPGDTDTLTGPSPSVVAVDESVESSEDLVFTDRVRKDKSSWSEEGLTLDLAFGEHATPEDADRYLRTMQELYDRQEADHLERELTDREFRDQQANQWTKRAASEDVARFGPDEDGHFSLRKIEIAPDASPDVAARVSQEMVARLGAQQDQGDVSPLIVVDGEIWGGTPQDLKVHLQGRPMEIQVLKGETAEARFGSRAENGVIVIDTDGD